MRCGCIDIGSNTTRLLVADVRDGTVREIHQERAMTRIGRDLAVDGAVSPVKTAEVAGVVAAQLERARELGAEAVRVVATHAIRDAANRDGFCAALLEATGRPVEVIGGDEEAHLAFLGATRTFPEPLNGTIAVVDVGGGSSEIAVGEDDVRWAHSVRVGSGSIADAYLRQDPPNAEELDAARAHANRAFSRLEPPRVDIAVAVGGSAASLRRLIGDVLDGGACERALGALRAEPSEALAARTGLDPERVRLLPAGLLVLSAASGLLGVPLHVGVGGIREAVCMELAAGR